MASSSPASSCTSDGPWRPRRAAAATAARTAPAAAAHRAASAAAPEGAPARSGGWAGISKRLAMLVFGVEGPMLGPHSVQGPPGLALRHAQANSFASWQLSSGIHSQPGVGENDVVDAGDAVVGGAVDGGAVVAGRAVVVISGSVATTLLTVSEAVSDSPVAVTASSPMLSSAPLASVAAPVAAVSASAGGTSSNGGGCGPWPLSAWKVEPMGPIFRLLKVT
mmetsp:Transcript_77294/g.216047  ORF Transcript_77294/g.216047 Transcript_77294/m.216047 type:complete len:222 (-) Transcript_77294:1099-1764(-)